MFVDFGWRGIVLALVFLADLIVFADLARAELSSLHTKQRQTAAAALRHTAAERPGA